MAVKTWILDDPISPADLNRIELNSYAANAGGTTTGNGTNYVLTLDAYQLTDMSSVRVKFHADNLVNPTLNINGTGAYSLFTSAGQAVGIGAIKAGSIGQVIYNASLGRFYVLGFSSEYVPPYAAVNKAGDTMTGSLGMANGTGIIANGGASLFTGAAGKTWAIKAGDNTVSAFNTQLADGTVTFEARADKSIRSLNNILDDGSGGIKIVNNDFMDLKTTKTNKDSNGVFTTVEQSRDDNTLAVRSVLSGGNSPSYTTRTLTYYGLDGATLLKTTSRTLTYDTDGTLISEV